VLPLDLDHHNVARSSRVNFVNHRVAFRQPQFAPNRRQFPLGNVLGQSRDHCRGITPHDPTTVDQLETLERLGRLDADCHFTTTRRIEARPNQPRRYSRPNSLQQRQKGLGEEIKRGGMNVVRTAAQCQLRRPVGRHQRRQHRLQDKGGAACRSNVEPVIARPNRSRLERKLLRIEFGSFQLRITHLGRRLDGREVLAHQPRLRASCSDLPKLKRFAGDHRQGERRAEDLSAPFAAGTIEIKHGIRDLKNGDSRLGLRLPTTSEACFDRDTPQPPAVRAARP